ncbi:MAG: CDP-diacylglycerol--glycerol-3-phosphate 3-phosphatidyltransferase [Deltaproteobacteria bacterium]|nr:MAG: CDP-diacylglycerol--glycerol-3-phosphate 3-phosphatidyltransferase [Deltaproteobacteria bacterium]
MRAASRPSPRRGSTWRACSATGWRTCGNERVSSPAADAVGRGTRAAALPNLLTLVRVGLVPVLVVALLWSTPAARALAALAFLVACITDFLDGWLARRHGMTTALGQLLDPLADKLIVAAALIMLAAVPPEPRVPAWMVVVIVLRELAVTGLRGIASSGGVTLAAQELGKYKMILQVFALEALLLHYRYPIPGTGLEIDFHAGGMLFLWMALALAVWSGVDYYVRILRQLRLD